MPLKNSQSKALQLSFLALFALTSAQVAWWMGESRHYSEQVAARTESLLREQASMVTAALSEGPSAISENLGSGLLFDAATGAVRVDPQAIEQLESENAGRQRRYLWEGGFFLVVLIAGMSVIASAIRHDAAMRRRQNNFIASVSHEFKSPLASIRLGAETLCMHSTDESAKRWAERSIVDCDRLLRTVDNLLDAARLEEAKPRVAPRTLALGPLVHRVAEEFVGRARLEQIDIAVTADEALEVDADEAALETILRNLIDNAIKACVAGDGSRVEVAATRTDEGVELSVTDDGMGFPPEEQALLFEKFYRVGDELQRSTPGTGLGLYVVQRLAAMSGATVQAYSRGTGQGARVSVSW
ncbi:MAG: sensor histidine kinase [Gammaproteobacteria bacterium]